MDDGPKERPVRIVAKAFGAGAPTADNCDVLTEALKSRFEMTAQEPLPEGLRSLMSRFRTEEAEAAKKLRRYGRPSRCRF